MLCSALSLQVNLLIPIAYLAFWAFLLVFSLYSEPVVCGVGLIIIFTGVPVFFLGVYWRNKPKCVNRLIGKHCHCGSVHSSGPVLMVCRAQLPLSPHQCRDSSKPSHHWHAQPSDPTQSRLGAACGWKYFRFKLKGMTSHQADRHVAGEPWTGDNRCICVAVCAGNCFLHHLPYLPPLVPLCMTQLIHHSHSTDAQEYHFKHIKTKQTITKRIINDRTLPVPHPTLIPAALQNPCTA